MPNQSNLKSLNLMFGSACNLNCGYCLQQSDKKKMNKKANVYDFGFYFMLYQLSNNLKFSSVNYWGGEPMLYWSQIKNVYGYLSGRNSTVKMHRITTNGTLITQKYVDFCNAHPDIFTVISYHDGNISDEQWKIIGKLNNFSISALIHHKRLSPLDLRDEYERIARLIDKRPPISFEMIKANDGCAPEYWLTREDVETYFESMIGIYELANVYKDDFCRKVIAHFLFRYKKDKEHKGVKPNPCVNENILSIDLFGNTYNCHHDNSVSNITGNIFQSYKPRTPIIPEKPIKIVGLDKYSKSYHCSHCSAYASCGGGCYTSNTHDVDCFYYQMREQLAETWLANLDNNNDKPSRICQNIQRLSEISKD